MPGKRQLKILISTLFLAAQVLWRLLTSPNGQRRSLVIIYYHSVPDAFRENFRRQLSSLARRVDVVPADYADTSPALRGRVAITFDDGLASVLENAIPELLERQMPCTIFFPSGAIGQTPSWDTGGEHLILEPVMDAPAVKALPSSLVTIGAHSVSHPRLTKVSIEESRNEIAASKASLEQLTGRKVSLFAFPYGDLNDAVVELCREQGYAHAYSIIPQVIDPRGGGFLRGRTSVDPGDGPLEFYLKSSGAYAWVSAYGALKRWLKAVGGTSAAARA